MLPGGDPTDPRPARSWVPPIRRGCCRPQRLQVTTRALSRAARHHQVRPHRRRTNAVDVAQLGSTLLGPYERGENKFDLEPVTDLDRPGRKDRRELQ